MKRQALESQSNTLTNQKVTLGGVSDDKAVLTNHKLKPKWFQSEIETALVSI